MAPPIPGQLEDTDCLMTKAGPLVLRWARPCGVFQAPSRELTYGAHDFTNDFVGNGRGAPGRDGS